MTLPLADLVIADFSRVLAGPLCASTLADLGATVIKVERPEVGDDTRGWGPPWSPTSSSYFDSANRSKLGVTLDLRDPEDRLAAAGLAARADVLIENFRSGTMERFGLDHGTVAATNPGIVYCSISGFGAAGGAGMPGYDLMVQALGGLMSLTGAPDGAPTKVGVPIVDLLTSKDAVAGILSALIQRQTTGRGQWVQVNLLSSLLGSLANQAAALFATGQSPMRMGNRHPSLVPYETFQCRTGSLVIACGNDGQFGRLAQALGRPDLATDSRFARNSDRVKHREELVTVLTAELAADDAAGWVELLLSRDVPAARVNTVEEAFALAGELGIPARVPLAGQLDQPAHPVRYSGFRPRRPFPPPALGEHDEMIRRWLAAPAGRSLAQVLDETASPITAGGSQ